MFYTAIEAAELLKVHPMTIKRAIKAGALKAAKVGKVYRISHGDLEAYYQAQGGELFTVEKTTSGETSTALGERANGGE